MTDKLSDLFPQAETHVVIEQWPGDDGRPYLRVYALGEGFKEFDEYSEHGSLPAALFAAETLSRKIGAPVFDLSAGVWNGE